MNKVKSTTWPAAIELAVVYIAVFMDWNWVWGILFLMWVIPWIVLRETHLIVRVRRAESPVLYWLIIGSWIGLSFLMIVWDIYLLLGDSQ